MISTNVASTVLRPWRGVDKEMRGRRGLEHGAPYHVEAGAFGSDGSVLRKAANFGLSWMEAFFLSQVPEYVTTWK